VKASKNNTYVTPPNLWHLAFFGTLSFEGLIKSAFWVGLINWGVKKINNAFKRCRYACIKAPGDGSRQRHCAQWARYG
jgi:hypothetical protein